MVEYLQEFKATDEHATQQNLAAAGRIHEAIASHALALFVVPAGVSEQCNAAASLCAEVAPERHVVIDVYDHEEAALKALLGTKLLELPVVFIQGRHISSSSPRTRA